MDQGLDWGLVIGGGLLALTPVYVTTAILLRRWWLRRKPIAVAAATETPLLHMFGQYDNHCEAWVLGNRAGLEILRDQIDRALASGIGRATSYVTDGEGFDTMIICADTDWQGETWQGQRLPYTTEFFAASEADHPSDLPQAELLWAEVRAEIAAERKVQTSDA